MHPGFKPMLSAKDFNLEHLQYPLLCSDKYDGFRNCQLPGLGGVSRKLEEIPNLKLREYFNRDILAGLDGELLFDDPTQHKARQKMGSVWNTIDGPGVDETPYGNVIFYVFDDFFRPEAGKFERYQNAAMRLKELNDPHIRLVTHKLVWNAAEVIEAFKDAEARGFEGVMLSDLDGQYKFGRATASYCRKAKKEGRELIIPLLLGKVKSFVDEEGEIIGVYEEEENQNEKTYDALGNAKRSSHKENKVGKGQLGGFILKSPKYPKEYRCSSSAIDHEERKRLWEIRDTLIGRELTYRFQPSGMDVVPQFTTFVDIRWD